MTRPYQYPAITKLSLAIFLIKQLNICVCNTVVAISAASEIDHTLILPEKLQKYTRKLHDFKDSHVIHEQNKNI